MYDGVLVRLSRHAVVEKVTIWKSRPTLGRALMHTVHRLCISSALRGVKGAWAGHISR